MQASALIEGGASGDISQILAGRRLSLAMALKAEESCSSPPPMVAERRKTLISNNASLSRRLTETVSLESKNSRASVMGGPVNLG